MIAWVAIHTLSLWTASHDNVDRRSEGIAMSEYWFARQEVNGQAGRGVHPLNWKGRAVIAGFVAAMVLGGAAFLAIGLLTQNVLLGAAVFAVSAFYGAATFLWAAAAKSDPNLRKPGS